MRHMLQMASAQPKAQVEPWRWRRAGPGAAFSRRWRRDCSQRSDFDRAHMPMRAKRRERKAFKGSRECRDRRDRWDRRKECKAFRECRDRRDRWDRRKECKAFRVLLSATGTCGRLENLAILRTRPANVDLPFVTVATQQMILRTVNTPEPIGSGVLTVRGKTDAGTSRISDGARSARSGDPSRRRTPIEDESAGCVRPAPGRGLSSQPIAQQRMSA